MRRWGFSVLLLAAACTETPHAPRVPVAGAPVVEKYWPAPPAAPRIRYEYAFDHPEDLGIRPSGVQRFWEALAGAEDVHMIRPYGVAVAGDRILVGDPGAKSVHLFDRARRRYLRIEKADTAELQSPVGVALGSDRLFVADSSGNAVHVFDFQGKLLASVQDLQRPTGLAFDPTSGQLFVAETLAHRIVVFDADGIRRFDFGRRGSGDAEFNYPSHLSLADGVLRVNDNMNFRIQSFDLQGRHQYTFGRHGDGSGFLSYPKGVVTDEHGHVYVAGATIDRIQVFSPTGDFLLAFGSEGDGPGQFVMPAGMASQGDEIFVADSYNRRIQVFRYVGAD